MAPSKRGQPGLTRAVLANPDVRGVVLAFAAITAAEWVLGAAVAIYAFGAGGTNAVGLVGVRFAVAAVAGLWSGGLAERHSRTAILTATAAARTVAYVVIAAALAAGAPLAVVVALVWLDAAVGSAYRPAQAALLPSLVDSPGELTAASALTSNAKTSGQVLGALGGGTLAALVSVQGAVAIAAALGLLACAAGTRARQRRRRDRAAGQGRAAQLRGAVAGIAALGRDAEAARIVRFALLRSLVRGLWVALAVVASIRLLGLGRAGFGILMAAAGTGAILAIPGTALLVGRGALTRWFTFGLLLCGVPIAVAGVSGTAGAIAAMVAWGVGLSLSDVTAQALLNRVVSGREIGRVTGAMESGKLLFEGLGSVLAPLLTASLSVRGALLATGGVLPLALALEHRRLGGIDARAGDRVALLELVRGTATFGALRVDALEGVVSGLRALSVSAGSDVIRQGEEGHEWYAVAGGELDVLVDGFTINTLGPGDGFGELALLRAVPRSATVRARTDVSLMALERDAFLTALLGAEAIGQAPFAVPHDLEPEAALRHVALFRACDAGALAALAEEGVVSAAEEDETLTTAGEHDDRLVVLLTGRARVLVDGAFRRELLPGDAFGEIAVLHGVARTATVVASEPCRLLALPGDAVRAAVAPAAGRAS